MAVRTDDVKPILELTKSMFCGGEAERPTFTPAKGIIIGALDMPPKWKAVEKPGGPKYGQRDYAASEFVVEVDGEEKARITFELIAFNDIASARNLFEGTLRSITFLPMTRLDVGWVGAMIDNPGKMNKNSKALVFVERNVVCLILVTHQSNYGVSNHWLISMARLQDSRIR